MSEKADFEPRLKRASHFVKIIVASPHRLPKLPESTLRKQARPNNGSLFYSHCDPDIEENRYFANCYCAVNWQDEEGIRASFLSKPPIVFFSNTWDSRLPLLI
jgi:hypothetical protein